MEEKKSGDIIWLEKDMWMKNLIEFGEVSVDYLEILENAFEESVIHYDFDEWIYILDGELLFFKGEEKILMKKGDSVFVPRKTVHGSVNNSGAVVQMLSVCSPPFTVKDMNKLKEK